MKIDETPLPCYMEIWGFKLLLGIMVEKSKKEFILEKKNK